MARNNWRYVVAGLSLLVGVTILSQSVFASNGRILLDPLNVPVTHMTHINGGFANGLMHAIGGDTLSGSNARCPGFTSGPGVCDHTQQSVEGAITDTETPTSTPTDSVTPSPAMLLVGHVIREGVCCSNNVQPVSLTLMMGGTQIDYPTQNTDASGFFTVSVDGLASGTYNWRAKDPKFLANAGTVTLTGAPTTQLEIGTLIAGDANNDNIKDAIDYSIVKANFGRACGSDQLCARAEATLFSRFSQAARVTAPPLPMAARSRWVAGSCWI